LYAEGADHVFLPRVLTARHLLRVIGDMLRNDETRVHAARAEQVEMLKVREEIIR